MEKYSKFDYEEARQKIIGLGQASKPKSYYPLLREKLRELEMEKERYDRLFHAIPDMMITATVLEKGYRIEDVNFDAKEYESLNKKVLDYLFYNSESKEPILSKVLKAIEDNDVEEFDFHLAEIGYFEVRIIPIHGYQVVFILRNKTKEKNLIDELEEMATMDVMTNTKNRTYFDEVANKIKQEKIENVGIVILDIDGLKFINDTLGHVVGDELIKRCAEVAKSCFGEKLLARIGGDEFGIIHIGSEEVLQKKIDDFLIKIKSYNSHSYFQKISVSIGFDCGPGDMIDTIFRRADTKMYQDKLLKRFDDKSHYFNIIEDMLETADFFETGHVNRMLKVARIVENDFELDDEQKRDLRLLVRYHDIGKVGIEIELIKRRGPLNSKEFDMMKTHCEKGFRIANHTRNLNGIAHYILKHHEWWNGEGYPLGLKGNEIPKVCRIFEAIDALDIMLIGRPYKLPIKFKEALKRFEFQSGKQFDPYVIEVIEEKKSAIYKAYSKN